jgi:hypothetical protein
MSADATHGAGIAHPPPGVLPGAAAGPPAGWTRKLTALGFGLGAVAFAVSGFLAGDGARFYASYLVAWLFAVSIALGGLFFVLLHHAVRAGWSTVVRRLAEHLAATMPLLAVLFVPVAVGLAELYPWARPEAAGDPLLAAKAGWLSPGFFLVRAAVVLGAWSLLAWWFRRRSLAQDGSGDPAISRRLKALAPPALIVFGLTLTVGAFDWIMSLDPHWYSTIFGVYFFAGSVVAVFATLILLAAAARPAGEVITAEHRHDLGKLLFAFVVFWAYIAFSQFMLIWYGNLPEETVWYAHRTAPGWEGATVALAAGHFVLPFFFLLSRAVKRRPATLVAGAVWMLAMHYLDLYWLVMPSLEPHGLDPHPLDAATLVAVVGFGAGALGLLARRRPLVPVRDPRLAESLSFENV